VTECGKNARLVGFGVLLEIFDLRRFEGAAV
jgi:hypothetical protein